MVQIVAYPLIASVVLLIQAAAQGGVESLSIPGYLPSDYVRASNPIGDAGPNDVYAHLAVRQPVLTSEEIVIYPHHFGFEYGQDSENSVYEITNARELVAKHGKKHHKHAKKHGKHHHDHQQEQHSQQHQPEEVHEQNQQADRVASASEPVKQFRPRPAFANNEIHPHFG